MNRQEWIDHWQDRLIGIALRGIVHDTDDRVKGPMDAGSRARRLVVDIPILLEKMWGTSQCSLSTNLSSTPSESGAGASGAAGPSTPAPTPPTSSPAAPAGSITRSTSSRSAGGATPPATSGNGPPATTSSRSSPSGRG
jgi:hypothetical protein